MKTIIFIPRKEVIVSQRITNQSIIDAVIIVRDAKTLN